MNSVRAIQQLNKRELEAGINPEGSWHTDYRDTAFVYIGGLPFELSEGDIITIFSQYGEPVWIKLARDKETGKSRESSTSTLAMSLMVAEGSGERQRAKATRTTTDHCYRKRSN